MSIPVSKMFGVSPRAIRDIWNRRTWEHATADLWGLEAFVEESEASSNEVLLIVVKLSPVVSNQLSPEFNSSDCNLDAPGDSNETTWPAKGQATTHEETNK
jgi:hypothetical protein